MRASNSLGFCLMVPRTVPSICASRAYTMRSPLIVTPEPTMTLFAKMMTSPLILLLMMILLPAKRAFLATGAFNTMDAPIAWRDPHTLALTITVLPARFTSPWDAVDINTFSPALYES